jgi:metallo-beta-lactamase class B
MARASVIWGAVLVAAGAALGGSAVHAGAQDAAARHVAAARAAAGSDHGALFTGLCTEPAPPSGRGGRGRAGGPPPGPPDRATWHADPFKAFDNLYFLGMRDVSAWAVTTSEGIIVIDALYDYSVEDEIINGLRTLGFDPATIKYVVVSHGHGDHSAGALALQDRFGARVVMSAADWDLLDRSTGRAPRPRRDLVMADGGTLTLGDTTLTFHLTPGHTPGTLSTLIPVRDGARTHMAAAWGGTAFNFPRARETFETYAGSARRFRDAVTRAGADVLISNHSRYDDAFEKYRRLTTRAPGGPHPFVVGPETVQRYLTVAEECAGAAIAWLEN